MAVGAYMLVNVGAGAEERVVAALKQIPEVKQAHIVTGLHDVVAYIEGGDLNQLRDVIIKKLRKIDGISRTVTCLAVGS